MKEERNLLILPFKPGLLMSANLLMKGNQYLSFWVAAQPSLMAS